MMNINHIGTLFFSIALFHSFTVSYFGKWAKKFPTDSAQESFFHLLSEVEIVFGFWAFLFLIFWAFVDGVQPAVAYHESLNMTEPLFIFCIMILASTRPLVTTARRLILLLSDQFSKIISVNKTLAQFFILMTVGPLLGSLITEPAAITIVSLLLYRMIDETKIDSLLLYSVVALLFVNISVGGALTPFAAPPILVVARLWGWELKDVFLNLGIASLATVFLNTITFLFVFKNKMLSGLKSIEVDHNPMPIWIILSHLFFLFLIVVASHHVHVFFGFFLIFIGLTTVTKKYQDGLKFREAFLVAFFLGGLIVFGSFQKWWLEPLLQELSQKTIFFSAIALTAITDNAALTYLGSQVPSLSELSKWALVSGSLVGGGLTILANAPNPAGFSILSNKFPNSTLNAAKLFMAAIPFTVIALLCFLFLGKF